MVILLKRARTKVGLAVVLVCVANGLILKETPFSLIHPNVWVWIGLPIILLGAAFRLAAYGYIKKKESLATTGVYSLCRHPLYLGSMLLTYGFCCLLDNLANWIAATIYFGIFYTTTILWEEVRLARRYGSDHDVYRKQVPVLLPFGRFRRNRFEWARAMRNGGAVLIGMTLILLIVVQIMAQTIHQ